MGNLSVPDHIMDDPTHNDLPSGMTLVGGRLMSSGPHVDGVVFSTAAELNKDSANLVLTRNAKGDWSLNRVAAGAETYNCQVNLSRLLARIGETYNLGLFGSGASPTAPAKGVQLIDVFAIYTVGVAALTTATLRVGKSVFVNNVALAQTDLLAATTTGALAAQANPYVAKVLAPGLAFMVDDTSIWEAELQLVMANTGTIKLYGVGAHFNFNYN